jgi:hypothetical protein
MHNYILQTTNPKSQTNPKFQTPNSEQSDHEAAVEPIGDLKI